MGVAVDYKGGRIYVDLFKWPTGGFHLEGVGRTVRRAYLLAEPLRTPLTVTQKGGAVDVALPEAALDPVATVLETLGGGRR